MEVVYSWLTDEEVRAKRTIFATKNTIAWRDPPWNERWSDDPDYPVRRWNSHALIDDYINDGGASFLTAEIDDQIVGFGIALCFTQAKLQKLDWLHLEPQVGDCCADVVIVDREFRGRGIFEELVQRRLDRMHAQQPRAIWVPTHATALNGTRKVRDRYLNDGFAVAGGFVVEVEGRNSERAVFVKYCK